MSALDAHEPPGPMGWSCERCGELEPAGASAWEWIIGSITVGARTRPVLLQICVICRDAIIESGAPEQIGEELRP